MCVSFNEWIESPDIVPGSNQEVHSYCLNIRGRICKRSTCTKVMQTQFPMHELVHKNVWEGLADLLWPVSDVKYKVKGTYLWKNMNYFMMALTGVLSLRCLRLYSSQLNTEKNRLMSLVGCIRLHKIQHNCQRCWSSDGDLPHILWNCSYLGEFWKNIIKITSVTTTTTEILCENRIWILGEVWIRALTRKMLLLK